MSEAYYKDEGLNLDGAFVTLRRSRSKTLLVEVELPQPAADRDSPLYINTLDYIDCKIRWWQKKLKERTEQKELRQATKERQRLFARLEELANCYIDAYQTMRHDLFGGRLEL